MNAADSTLLWILDQFGTTLTRYAPAGVVEKQKLVGSRGSESSERRQDQMCTGKRAEAMQKEKQREDEGEREKRRTKA